MITLIIGKKGSGKTKKLLSMCAQALEESKGNVVFVEKDATLTYDLSHKARLVIADEYAITGFEALYGFLAGMCAGNYDITDVFVDAALRIGGSDMAGLEKLVEGLSKLSDKVNFVLSVSADKAELPASIETMATEI